ncbi:hypothetical protein [Streptomyces xiamenensis]|uniref:hypothetical protein n=1 Tax=Streptomyces xiamenensis TaxID=408015 RepID=UPI003D74C436
MTTEIVRAQPSLPEKMQYAQAFAEAGLLPSQYRRQPANLLYALEYAESLNLHPMAAITGIHVIEGKPSASSALISALVRRAGHRLRVTGDDRRAVAQIVRADDPEFTFEAVWTLERAEQAGLVQVKDGRPFARSRKGEPLPWERFTASMLKARAITEVARAACEEALSGLHYTPEELGARVDAEGMPLEAEVQQLRRVPAGEPDPWAVPPPQPAAQQRDFLHEANAAADADAVRQIYREAVADGAVPEYLAQIAEVGKAKAAAAVQSADEEPLEGEVVDEHADAVAELRALAAELEIDDIDADAHGALGAPLEAVAAAAIRGLTAQLRGAA